MDVSELVKTLPGMGGRPRDQACALLSNRSIPDPFQSEPGYSGIYVATDEESPR
jgi:hypothetical protein